MGRITVCDSTLRDGSHAVGHQFTVEQVRAVARALDAAGVPLIEVSHGDGLGGSSINYGRSGTPETRLIEVAVEEVKRARIAVLLLPGIGTKKDLLVAHALGATVVRVATHCTEADIACQHIELARSLGFTTVGFLMMAHMTSPAALAAQAQIMADSGAEVVYVTDSAGALTMQEARERIRALRETLPTEVAVGYHGHSNLALGVANSLIAVEEGATWVDACTCGLGAGAGNTPTEVLVAVCAKQEVHTGIDIFAMMDVAEEVVRPIIARLPTVDRAALILGYAGVYSSFLLHAKRASRRFGVSDKDILVEVGRRKAVGGQEDLIIEIASELAR